MGELLLTSCAQAIKTFTLPGSLASSKEESFFKPHAKKTNEVQFTQTGDVILSCSDDGSIVVSRRSGRELGRLSAAMDQTGGVNSIATCSNSRLVLAAGEDGYIRVWDMKLRKIRHSIGPMAHPVTKMSINKKETTVVAGTSGGELVVYNLEMNRVTATLRHTEENRSTSSGVRSVYFNVFRPDIVAVGTDSGSVHIWDISTKTMTATFPRAHVGAVSAVVFSPVNRSLLMSVGLDKRIALLATTKSKVLLTIDAPEALTCASFAPTGDRFAVGTVAGNILLYDLRGNQARGQNQLTHKIEAHFPGPVNDVSFFIPVNSKVESASRASSKPSSSTSKAPLSAVTPAKPNAAANGAPRQGNGAMMLFSPSMTPAKQVAPRPSQTPVPSSAQTQLRTKAEERKEDRNNETEQRSSHEARSAVRQSTGAVSDASKLPSEAKSDIPVSRPRHHKDQAAIKAKAHLSSLKVSPNMPQFDEARNSPASPHTAGTLGSTLPSPPATQTKSQSPSRPFVRDEVKSSLTDKDAPLQVLSEEKPKPFRRKYDIEPRPASTQYVHDNKSNLSAVSQSENGALKATNERSGDVSKLPMKDQDLSRRVAQLDAAIQSVAEESREGLRDLQLEMMRQFRLQMQDIRGCLDEFSSRFASLEEENSRLRKENERLRLTY
mmetsp:Transcript_7878/g.13931  ORF Transcript_7878/g.13931 Transcript_7878/m.13931 type:complete len:663 (+) Transcript_7878:107-2095(+)